MTDVRHINEPVAVSSTVVDRPSFLGRAVLASVMTAELTALSALPWARFEGMFLAALLGLPPALLSCLIIAALERLVAGRPSLKLLSSIAALLLMVGAGLAGLSVGISNVLLIDEPLKPRMLRAYAISFAATTVVVVGLWLRLRRVPFVKKAWSEPPPALLGIAACVMAALAAITDAVFLTHGYWTLHVFLLAVTLIGFGTFSWNALSFARARSSLLKLGGALTLGCVVSAARAGGWSEAIMAVLAAPTSHQRLLSLARQVLDDDGDGFSNELAGGDCNDASAQDYPLSSEGHDCLGWLNASRPRPELPSPEVRRSTQSAVQGIPQIIVLVTIDAFRCGFGRAERVELLDACPRLTELARQGRFRLHGYTTYPKTAAALRALNTIRTPASNNGSPRFLGEALRELGWTTTVLGLPLKEFRGPEAATFDRLDDSLDPTRMDRAVTNSEIITDAVLSRLRKLALEHAERVFVWAHYLDPHAPYVLVSGSPWTRLTSTIHRYRLEIERTDAALGRLASGLEQLPGRPRVFLFITADHGEGLGEDGRYYHGNSIHESMVRVPMLAWSTQPEWLQSTHKELPVSLAEVGSYLISVASGQSFTSSGVAFFQASVRGGSVLGVHKDGWKLIHHQVHGWTRLYNVFEDPEERVDLLATEVARAGHLIDLLRSWILQAHIKH